MFGKTSKVFALKFNRKRLFVVSMVEVLMQMARVFRHSSLFLRNTLIVWTCTILVFWMVFRAPQGWFSMLAAVLGVYLNYFVWVTYRSVHPGRSIFRRRIPKLEVDLKAERVEFLSQDGLQICGWFIPGEKRQVIILLHGLGGSGLAMSHQARVLRKAGYSVLMPDLRAHGDSEGDSISGALEGYDVLGALDYLATRPDVDMKQVGILGVSFGALVALRAARQTKAIRAVVLDSIGPANLVDHGGRPKTVQRWINYPFNWLIYTLFDLMSGVQQEEGVIEALRLVYPRPVLLISTGRGKEQYFIRKFYEAARRPKAILEVPDASHGIAVAINQRHYREQVLQVFEQGFRNGGW
jgi:pimeloyl-ACP methyl ester carboxylesterase